MLLPSNVIAEECDGPSAGVADYDTTNASDVYSVTVDNADPSTCILSNIRYCT
jgi:hypothetical protein